VAEFQIEVASRYFKRQFQKAVGRSVLKVLTELITNADDSYRRLAVSIGSGAITINFDRRKRAFSVIDLAEGLSEADMEDAFVTYGKDSGDRGRGARTRSLFGKGLRDVLFTQEAGVVESIKDGVASVSKFRWRDRAGNERPTVEIRPGPRVTPELRAAWGIPGNGTRVQFKLAEGVPVPQYERLGRDLENFYMLRRITSRDDRLVVLRTRTQAGWEERRLRHTPPAPSATTFLGDRSWKFEYEGYEIEAAVDLRAFESSMVQGEQSQEDREGGLLVVDEDDDVLDLTLMGFDEEPAASRLFGELRLAGVGRLIRERLSAPAPEEILTETRDGFDRRNPFFRALRAQVDPWLKTFVDAERDRLGSRAAGLSDEARRRHERAFDRLNALAKELLGQTSGPGTGPSTSAPHTDLPLEFRMPRTTIRTGSYRSVQLLVNTVLVPPGSEVRLSSADRRVVFPTDTLLEVPDPADVEPTVVIAVRLEGLEAGDAVTTAEADNGIAQLECSIVDEDIPDMTPGLVFFPDTLELRDGERSHLRLYADLRVVGQAGDASLDSTNPKIEILTGPLRWEPVTSLIVKSAIPVVGRGKGEEALLTARLGGIEAVAFVKVISKRQERDRREGGMFKGYKFASLERHIQATLDTEGYVVINLVDPANRFHFGNDVASATRHVEERGSSQTRLADLVLEECIQRAVSEAYQNGKLKIRFPGDPTTDIRNYVAEERFELDGEVHRLFVRAVPASGH
jgi:hypothetical protein